jgi:ribosomal protein S18 acetylase RimI-like enzyme
MVNALTLRDETSDDVDFLYRLYASTRDDEMKLVPWSAEQKEAFLRMQFKLQTSHYRQHFAAASFMIILCEGRPAGRFCVHRGEKEIRVVDIALLPEFRNAGIATGLFKNLLAEAELSGKRVTMHVLRNSPALRLYERLGFRLAEDKGAYLFVEWRSPGHASDSEFLEASAAD